MNTWYPAIAERAALRCEYCRAPEAAFNFPFEVEHIIPRSLDGDDEEENLALACRSCNLRKGSHVNAPDAETGTTARLYHPRIDDWYAHFRLDSATSDIIGLTDIERATVNCLDMNSESQQDARKVWTRLGWIP